MSRLFAQHGATVEVAEHDQERADTVVADITGAGGVAEARIVDVRDPAAVDAYAADVLERRGRVDVLVNNVGDFRPFTLFEQSDPDSWEAMYQVNLRHVFAVTRAFIRSMIGARRGSIVNIHSVEAMRGYPGEPVYGAMKAAVAHFTTNLAVRYGRHGIRANGIGPDLTQTPQVDYLSGYEDHDDLWTSWAPVGRLGLARGPGPRRALPRVRHVGLRHRPQHPGRRRHPRRRRVVLLAGRAPLRQPLAEPLTLCTSGRRGATEPA